MAEAKEPITSRPQTITAQSDAALPPTLTVTRYEKLAEAMMAEITATANQIPGYLDDLSGIGKRIRKSVPPSVIFMVVTAVEASPELAGVNQLDTVETRDTLQFSEAFRPAVAHILGVAKRLELIMDVREAKAGRNALNVYSIARRVARNPNNTRVAVNVEAIRAELRRRRIGRIQKPRPATPQPGEGDAPTE